MEVLINEKPVDVTLEDERTLGEVLDELRGWLGNAELYITDVVVDEQNVRLDTPESWAAMSIDDVGRIEINALPPWQVKANGLRVIASYFEILRDVLQADDRERLTELSAEAQYIAEGLPTYAGDLVNRNDRSDVFFRIIDAPEVRQAVLPDAERRRELQGYLDQAVTVLRARQRELSQPHTEAWATSEALQGLLSQVTEVSVLLQRGEDREAMDLLVRFTELTSKLLRVMPQVARTTGSDELSIEQLERYGAELNATLEELVEAFGVQDSVLIGDLVEYELVPKIEELIRIVPPVSSETA
ncbi:MAG: hypothetical protein ACLFRR_08065 [Spirochaetaceae bacterium]